MIKIRKKECPSQLDTNCRTLVENDYKNEYVINCLLDMQYHKCCYCEKDLHLIGKTAMWVEHFIARTDDSFKDVNGNINWNALSA